MVKKEENKFGEDEVVTCSASDNQSAPNLSLKRSPLSNCQVSRTIYKRFDFRSGRAEKHG